MSTIVLNPDKFREMFPMYADKTDEEPVIEVEKKKRGRPKGTLSLSCVHVGQTFAASD